MPMPPRQRLKYLSGTSAGRPDRSVRKKIRAGLATSTDEMFEVI